MRYAFAITTTLAAPLATSVACTSEIVADRLGDDAPTSDTADPGLGDDGTTQDNATGSSDWPDGDSEPSLADALLELTAQCDPISEHLFSTDPGAPADVPVCALPMKSVFWRADMDVTCNGRPSMHCNADTDPDFVPETAAKNWHDESLDAARLPYVVLPVPSSRFDYRDYGIRFATVIAVIYNGELRFGVFADLGAEHLIGEASYAMVDSFGVDPAPTNGGIDHDVTYIVFGGDAGVVHEIDEHHHAVDLGVERARALVGWSD